MMPTRLQIKEVQFNGDTLLATQDSDGNVYAGVSYICNGIGLSKSQKDTQIQNVQSDIVLKRGCLKFQAGVFDPNNATVALLIDFLPLWLAKISITPKMQENSPELVEKLIVYQLKAKDVLAAAFLPQHHANQLTTLYPLLDQSVYHLQQSQQNLINCVQEHGYQINSMLNRISTLESGKSFPYIEESPIQQLISQRNDTSPHGCATYRIVYSRMATPRWWNEMERKYRYKYKVYHPTPVLKSTHTCLKINNCQQRHQIPCYV